MNIAGINYESIVDGEGVRTALFISGCKHNCEGCHNKEAQAFDYGEPFTEEMQERALARMRDIPFHRGITLTGGDPMFSAEELIPFVERYRKENLGDVWIFSGFTYDQIKADPIKNKLLQLCDVLVDGQFIQEKHSPNLNFRGSTNQNIIRLNEKV